MLQPKVPPEILNGPISNTTTRRRFDSSVPIACG
jgi:hypothetical protein